MTAADQRVLRNAKATLTATFRGADGEPVDADDVTVTVARADGTTLVTDATAVAGTGTGVWTYQLAATHTAQLDVVTATWTATSGTTTTTHEIVGGYYFSITEAITAEPSIANTDARAVILATRSDVEDEFETICGVAFVPRYRRITLDGTGTHDLIVPDAMLRTIVAVTLDGTAVDTADVSCDANGIVYLRRGWTAGRQNVTIAYEHGYDLTPSDVKRAAIQRLRQRLNMQRSGIPDRATSFQMAEGGGYRLDMAGIDKVGTPDIDAVLARYSRRTRAA